MTARSQARDDAVAALLGLGWSVERIRQALGITDILAHQAGAPGAAVQRRRRLLPPGRHRPVSATSRCAGPARCIVTSTTTAPRGHSGRRRHDRHRHRVAAPPEPAPRRHEEADLLATVMSYLGWALPADAIAHHSPGEGQRTKRAQGELKRSGYVTGWPDVEVCYQGRVIFIELKTARGTLSTAQRNTHRRLTYCGATVLCCRSLACVEELLRELGVPLRATVA